MTTATALLGRGKEITLLDGTKATVVFDLEALAQIEEDFGSLGGWQDALNNIAKEQMNAKMMRPLLQMLRAGLLHDPRFSDSQFGKPAFDPQRLEEYFTAVMGAAEQAFPQGAQGAEATTTTVTAPSLGPTSITSLPSSSDEATAPSGA